MVQPSVVSVYTFDTLGEYTVKYTLIDPTSIGESTFESCSSLTSIDIPDSIISIDYCAFFQCSSLTSIDIPDSVTSIGSSAFEYCRSLTSCTIGSGVTSIGEGAFSSCDVLTTSITINATTPPTLGTNAFETYNTIYVPCESVDIYKTATNWSNYTIEGIPPCGGGDSGSGSGGGSESQSSEYVEIAGIKWATMNVGANSVTDTGLYFQWGDTQGYTADQVGGGEGLKYFDWEDYKYTELDTSDGNGSGSGSGSGGGTYKMTKYNETDDKTALEASDDAVAAAWGGNWRMPTTAEYVALGNAVNTAWTADYQGSGIAGMICTDKTDSSKVLFFPAAGRCGNGSVGDVGSYGLYWSSSLNDGGGEDGAYFMEFDSGGVYWTIIEGRSSGFSVRGVLGE